MRFNPKARLDTSRVRDVGGRGGMGGGGMRIPIPGGTKAGGGLGGILIIVLFLVLTQTPNQALERTAARRAFPFQMIKTVSIRPTLGLGGVRSAFSR